MRSRIQTQSVVVDAVDGFQVAKGRELFRLTLVGGCIAAATSADLAGSALPEPKLVAVGAALLGGLLVLRRRSKAPDTHAEDPAAIEPQAPAAAPRRRSRNPTAILEQRLEVLVRQVEDLERRFTSLSGRQSVIQVAARDRLDDTERRLDRLEADVELEHTRRGQQAQQVHELLARLVDDAREITRTAKRLG